MEQGTGQKNGHTGRGKGHILVVDDEIEILKFIETVLKKNGYSVTVTHDAFHALNLLEKNDFDIAITDLKMPQMSGVELLEIIKEKYPKVKVLIITASARTDLAIKCIEKGANDYLIKPFTLNQLKKKVESLVK
ncbi:MAG: response regulator [Elusimicrobia bacterium]|nr:response regulator [Elusimicrobiota bacterium]